MTHTPGPWTSKRGAAVAYDGDPYQVVSQAAGTDEYVAKVDAVIGSAYAEDKNAANGR